MSQKKVGPEKPAYGEPFHGLENPQAPVVKPQETPPDFEGLLGDMLTQGGSDRGDSAKRPPVARKEAQP